MRAAPRTPIRAAFAAVALVAFASSGCSSDSSTGATEPFRVSSPASARFIAGELPGLPPLETPAEPTPPTADGGVPEQGLPGIIDFTSAQYAFQGQGAVRYQGTASPNAYSVGLRLEEFGTGYWVVPVGDPEQGTGTGNLSWDVSADYSDTIPAGFANLLAVAFDENGEAGQQLSKRICVGNRVEDNFNTCVDTIAPPAAVISLTWVGAADLDLQVRTPDGTLVWAKHPTTVAGDAGAPSASDGRIDLDANAACRGGISQENLVWQTEKPVGKYLMYVNLFDSCRQPAVHFEVEVYTGFENEDGTKGLKKQYEVGGELVDFQANGGSQPGLYINQFTFK